MRQPRVRSLRQVVALIERAFAMAAIRAVFRAEMPRRIASIAIFGCIVLAILGTSVPAGAQLLRSSSETPTPAITISEDATSEEIDDAVAQMTDRQVREELLSSLHERAEKRRAARSQGGGGAGVALVRFRLSVERFIGQLKAHAGTVRLGLAIWPAELSAAVEKVSGSSGPALLLFQLAILFALGLAAFALVNRSTRSLREGLYEVQPSNLLERGITALTRAGIEMLASLGFAVASFLAIAIGFAGGGPERSFLVAFLTGALLILVVRTLLRAALAPSRPRLRLAPLSDYAANFVARWALWLVTAGTLLWILAGLLILSGMPIEAHLVSVLMVGAVMTLLVCVMAFDGQAHVARVILGPSPGPSRVRLAANWHWLFVLYMLIVYAMWSFSMLSRAASTIWPALVSLVVVVVLPLVDRRVQRNLGALFDIGGLEDEAARTQDRLRASGPQGDEEEAASSEMEDATSRALEDVRAKIESRRNYLRICHQVARAALAAVLIVFLSELWGISLIGGGDGMDEQVMGALTEVGLVILVTWVLWRVAIAFIDPHLPKTQAAAIGEEGTSAPRTRTQTLLPLLRNAVAVILIVFSTMIALSSLGVDIGPLLAGAGVIGIAVGFGAQTLVKDIVSGIFFLIDDAFRVGEYIEFENIRGEVEAITLRSLRLRHHRGAVHTIPFGELRSITNYHRDWAIYKMEFRVPYESDIEKIRKIIKKIGLELLEHPELGPGFIEPLKSQGVSRMEDSAMIIRTKFTCKPGEQWVIRREAYRRIKEAFEANGIEFAHRRVIVNVPPNSGPEAAGAAASQVHQAEPGTN